MPTTSSNVGGFVLPIPAGALNDPLVDPVLLGLGDFLRFMLKDGLDAKLARIQGTSPDALPAGNLFPYDPSTYFVRNQTPALYVWWPGRAVRVPWRLTYDVRVRRIAALYVFDEIVAPGGLETRHGLTAAVDAVFARAAELGGHPAYGYEGAPPGTALYTSLGIEGWTYEGGEPGYLTAIPSASAHEGLSATDGAVQRGYPSLRCEFAVYEKIGALGAPVPGVDDNKRLGFREHATDLAPAPDDVLIRGQ